jgi:2-keto-4-pentenoate hydratase/2-oxohepta-3-ene-1,7-dioic acid hydratase in catechol pathway
MFKYCLTIKSSIVQCLGVRTVKVMATLMALTLYALPGFSGELAPIDEAVTLAQVRDKGRIHTLLVLADRHKSITGIDLSAYSGLFVADPFQIVRKLGHQGLVALAQSSTAPKRTWPYTELLPVSRNYQHHVAVGTNYPEHAEETDLDEGVFLFPKIVQGTPPITGIVAKPDYLLDYEVELCVQFDRVIKNVTDFAQSQKGFFVCGDFTDRASLLREVDTSNIESGIGFTDAKSMPGFFPTGPYLVIPRDWQGFLEKIRLRLFVNEQLRQDAQVVDMIMPLDEIVTTALQTGREARWRYAKKPVSLLPKDKLQKGAVVLTGTPAGVVFRPPGTGFIVRHGLGYVFSGAFLKTGPVDYVVEKHIDRQMAEGKYLKPGDSIALTATFLGAITVTIVN